MMQRLKFCTVSVAENKTKNFCSFGVFLSKNWTFVSVNDPQALFVKHVRKKTFLFLFFLNYTGFGDKQKRASFTPGKQTQVFFYPMTTIS